MVYMPHNAHPKKVFTIIAIISVIIVSIWFYLNNKNIKPVSNVVPSAAYIQQNTKLEAKYISTPDTVWPPKVNTAKGKFECNETGSEVQSGGKTVKKIIDGKTYCVTGTSEGAAGSTYTTYSYSTLINGKIASISFVLRFTQCMNYPDQEQAECLTERKMFDPDGLANAVIENARL